MFGYISCRISTSVCISMKMLVHIILIIIFLSPSCSVYAVNSKLMVIPYEDKTGESGEIVDELTKVAQEQVKESDDYEYVSEEEFHKNWLDPAVEEIEKTFEINMPEEKFGLEQLRPMFVHDNLGTIFEWKKNLGADFVIIGEIKKENGSLQIDSEIIGMDTGRFYSVSVDCKAGEVENTVREQIKLLLDKGSAVQQVEADTEVDHLWSIVSYNIQTVEGDVVQIRVDYTSERPNPILQNLEFVPAEELKEGMKVYKLQTKEKKPIEFSCSYKNGQLENIKIYTDPPSGLEGVGYSEKLSVVSQDGYIINFVFDWSGKELKEVNVEPLINPYCEVE